MSKHSPAPWKITRDGEIVDAEGNEVCWGYHEDFGALLQRIKPADRRLIAAAPDLADELDKAHDIIRALSQAVNKYVPVGDPVCSVDIRWNDRAALLEKAIGLVK